jgi:hypothetical protein
MADKRQYSIGAALQKQLGSGLLRSDLAAGIRRVKGVRNLGMRLGNWVTVEQSLALWQAPNNQDLKGKLVLSASPLSADEVCELASDH